MYRSNLTSVGALSVRLIAIEVLLGVANPNLEELGFADSLRPPGRRGSGMVPFERVVVSSYRPSIVTFHLSLCVSEILSLLCSSTFSHQTSSLPQITPRFPGNRWMAFGLQKAMVQG